MTQPGEKVKWRAHFTQLIARPIPKSEFPVIAKRMFDDGLYCVLSPDTGYQWYSGRYAVSAAAVREVWGLSRSQWSRYMGWVYEEDPFSSLGGEVDETQIPNGSSNEGH